MPKTLDEAIAEKQAEFDALDMQSADPPTLKGNIGRYV